MGIGSWVQRKKDQVFNAGKKVIDKTIDTVTDVGKAVINIALSPFTGGFDIPDISVDSSVAIDQATSVDFTPSNSAIPVCYGKYVERGLKTVFVDTAGDKNQYLYMCGVIGLGMTQDDNAGSRLFNLTIDDTICDIITATPKDVFISENNFLNGPAVISSYTTDVNRSLDNYYAKNSNIRGDGFPRFGGKGGTQPPIYQVKTGAFKNRVEFQLFDGSDDQPASSLLKESDRWDNTNQLRGVQYIALKFTWTNDEITDENGDNLTNPFSSLPRVVVMAPGKNVPKLVKALKTPGSIGYQFDTDIDDTGDTFETAPTPADWTVAFASNSYSHTATRQDGYDVSGNPVEILLDYMLNDRYGAGISLDKIDQQSFINAAVACGRIRSEDTTFGSMFATNFYGQVYDGVTGTDVYPDLILRRSVGKNDKIASTLLRYDNSVYYRQFVIDTGITHLQNINRILTSMGGIMPFVNGKFKLTIENSGTPDNSYDTVTDNDLKNSSTFTFTDDNIVGSINLTGGALENTFNEIKVNFTDIEQRSQNNAVVYPNRGTQYDIYKREDNGIELKGDVTNAGIVNPVHAYHFGKVLVAKSRQQQRISFKTTEAATNLTPGDLIRVNTSVLSFDHIFRIEHMTMDQYGDIEITAFRHYVGNYNFNDRDLLATNIDFLLVFKKYISRETTISPVANIFRAPQGLTAKNKAVVGVRLDQGRRSDILVTWKDGNINAGNNSYEVQIKRNTDAEQQYISLGTTSNQEFTINTSFYAFGEKLSVRVRTISPNGTFSSFTTTAVTNKPYYGGEFENNVFPYFKKYADDAFATLSSGGSTSTGIGDRKTTQTSDTGEI